MKITLKQIRKGIIVLFFVVLAGGIGYSAGQSKISLQKNSKGLPNLKIERILPLDKQSKVDFNLFWQVWDELEKKHLNRASLDYQKMIYGAISGMVASLDDPYTVFLPPSENKDSKDDLRGDFEGVGIQIGYNKDKLITVVAPLEGTPAKEAGLKSGDVITKIIDEPNSIDRETLDLSLPEAVRLIRGKKGTKVTLAIYRPKDDKNFEVDLKRDTIVVKSVELSFEQQNNKQVAVLKLSRFGERTDQEWQQAVDQIKQAEEKNNNFGGIVLDLRDNPGGFLQGAVFIASEFLSSSVVVQQDSGVIGKEIYKVNRQGSLLAEPLVVLINSGSASASEIVAGALQETKRATLVGEKSFGKGTVQEAEDLAGGAGLHVTVSRWLLPSGKSIDKEGILPDVEVKADEEQIDDTQDLVLQKAVEILTK